MVKIIICGIGGRMGTRIAHCALGDSDIALAGGVDKTGHASVGKDIAELTGGERLGIQVTDNLKSIVNNGDTLIDFSSHDAAVEHVRIAKDRGKSVVVGTTGFTDKELDEIRQLAREIPCVVAPNMSLGVNLLFNQAGEIARALGDDYDIEIVEAHHRFKTDAPSGTAKRLAEVIAESTGRDLSCKAVYGRQGVTQGRQKGEIGIHAVRAGDIVGDHTVVFCAPGERIELTHRAHSRDTFARGALTAAKFVVRAKPGLYTMQDVLGLSRHE